jgi:hypothetical protein
VDIVRIDVSEELSASFIRVTRIGELGTLAITSNQLILHLVFFYSVRQSNRSNQLLIYIDDVHLLGDNMDTIKKHINYSNANRKVGLEIKAENAEQKAKI